MNDVLLSIEGLTMDFHLRGKRGVLRAVNGVTLSVRKGQTLGVVGESGCGKSTMGYCIVRALAPTEGSIRYRLENGEVVDLAAVPERELKPYRRDIRMIFQDPFSSLNPRMTVFDLIAEPLRIHGMRDRAKLGARVAEMLERTGMRPEFMRRYPHAFSGGQRQRIVIARALALSPRLVVADEAVSALDVSVQAQILNLMRDLQTDLGLTYVFISHALNVVEYMADHVAVMYLGNVVETGPTDALFSGPRHPYTEALLSAIPVPDPSRRSETAVIEGDVPDPLNPPSGCPFRTRCVYAQEPCSTEKPALREAGPDRQVACHFSEDLDLAGADYHTPAHPGTSPTTNKDTAP